LKAIPIKTRKFVQYDFDFTEEMYIPSIDPNEFTDAIVKVTIRVKQEEAHRLEWLKKFEDYIRTWAYHLKPVTTSLVRTKKLRNKKINADISALDAIKYWVDDKKPKYASEIIQIAEEIVRDGN
jgi:hypothetical protein